MSPTLIKVDPEPVILTEGLTSPAIARNITATAGGTAGDIAAIAVIVEGTDLNGDPITETLPAFSADTPATKKGSLAFKTVTKVTIPAHDGTGATTAIGWDDALGLPYRLPFGTLLVSARDGSRETSNLPTLATDPDELAANTITYNGALNGESLDAYLIV